MGFPIRPDLPSGLRSERCLAAGPRRRVLPGPGAAGASSSFRSDEGRAPVSCEEALINNQEMAPPTEGGIQIGPHRFWCVGDLSVVEVVGDLDASHVTVMQQVTRPLFDEYGYTLTLVDASKAGTMTPEARRASAVYQRLNSIPGAVGIFGVSALAGVLVSLYSRAIALFATRERETAMFRTEAEARAWLDAQRLKLRTALGRSL